MTVDPAIEREVGELRDQLERDAEAGGYHLNPDQVFTREPVRGLLVNIRRYGYPSCPCRLASGKRSQDLDLICPCDYRDQDLGEWGACYCGLYVTRAVLEGRREIESIPERRSMKKQGEKPKSGLKFGLSRLKYPVWRCKVCGYLCARDKPPDQCPICKVSGDRFERLI